jgi:LysR family transcriptional regulator of abg operon
LAVCRAGTIVGAGRLLNISQPSLSATMAQLEASLGTQLFTRSRLGIELTAAGIALRRNAEALEMLLKSAEQEVELALQQVDGPLVVGGTPGALASLMPTAISSLRRTHPRLQLQVLERPDHGLLELLRSERIELAMVTTGIDAVPDDLIEVAISQDPFDLIVGPANAHLPDRMKLHDLHEMRWILPDAVGAFRRQVDALFAAADATAPVNTIRCDSLLTTKAIVRQSDYITILPRQVAAAELRAGVLRAIELENARFMRSIGIRRLAGHELSPIANAFLQAVVAAHE